MAFEGSFEDMPVVDVLQLLNVARKTGTLRVVGTTGAAAMLVLREGAIVGARHPNPELGVGRVLVELGHLRPEVLTAALAEQQQASEPRKPLVAALVETNQLSAGEGAAGLRRLIELTVGALVEWQSGTFVFDPGEVLLKDSIGHVPLSVLPEGGMDTQHVLVRALQILDERNRDVANAAPLSEAPALKPIAAIVTPTSAESSTSVDETDSFLATLERQVTNAAGQYVRVLLYCNDGYLKHSLRTLCRERGIDQLTVEAADELRVRLMRLLEDGVMPIVVVDASARNPALATSTRLSELLATLRQLHPEVPIVVLANPGYADVAAAYGLGVDAVVPRPLEGPDRTLYAQEMRSFFEALIGCLVGFAGRRSLLIEHALAGKRQMAALKARSQEMRVRGGAPDISLALVRYVAELMDRCLIFMVRKNSLMGLGASGIGRETVSTAVGKLRIPLRSGSLLADVVEKGYVYSGSNVEPGLSEYLYAGMGAPSTPQMTLVPLCAGDRTAALIYGDFGKRQATPVLTDALEVLAVQAGLALELVLARASAQRDGATAVASAA